MLTRTFEARGPVENAVGWHFRDGRRRRFGVDVYGRTSIDLEDPVRHVEVVATVLSGRPDLRCFQVQVHCGLVSMLEYWFTDQQIDGPVGKMDCGPLDPPVRPHEGGLAAHVIVWNPNRYEAGPPPKWFGETFAVRFDLTVETT